MAVYYSIFYTSLMPMSRKINVCACTQNSNLTNYIGVDKFTNIIWAYDLVEFFKYFKRVRGRSYNFEREPCTLISFLTCDYFVP